MIIQVQFLAPPKIIEIDVEPNDSIRITKEKIEDAEGIPPEKMQLIFSGNKLEDIRTLADYNIQPGSKIQAVTL
jgi:hypothetical protein